MSEDREDKDFIKLTGTLCTFGFGEKKRRWISLNRSFGEAKKFLTIEEYSIDKGTGEQRGRIQAWCKHLGKQMVNVNFTPASWAAGIRESHLQYLKIEGNKVTLLVPKDNPIPCLDGNQRWGGMEYIYESADPALKRVIDACTITLQIYLDPEEIKQDFKRLQMGRPVDKSHLLSLELSDEEHIDAKEKPYLLMVKDVARRLNVNPESPLLNQIKFDSSEKKAMSFATIATKQASELSTSLRGGANIALHDGYNRDAVWLTKMYIAAYQAIYKYGSKVTVDMGEGDVEFPRLLLKKRVLRGTLLGGGKGSSSLLVGLGNALAFRMAHLGKDEPSGKDLKYLIECVEDIFMEDVDGNMSGGTKRKYMGMFGRRYFRDITVQDGETPEDGKLSGRSGIPAILCELTSNSSWGVTREWEKRQLSVNGHSQESEEEEEEVQPTEYEDVDSRIIPSDTTADFFDSENESQEVEIEPEDESQDSPDEEEEVEVETRKKSRGRKKKAAMG